VFLTFDPSGDENMNGNGDSPNADRKAALARVADPGRNWKAVRDALEFRKPAPLFDQPMEITVQMLRGLRMVDETIVVHGDVRSDQDEGAKQ